MGLSGGYPTLWSHVISWRFFTICCNFQSINWTLEVLNIFLISYFYCLNLLIFKARCCCSVMGNPHHISAYVLGRLISMYTVKSAYKELIGTMKLSSEWTEVHYKLVPYKRTLLYCNVVYINICRWRCILCPSVPGGDQFPVRTTDQGGHLQPVWAQGGHWYRV